jgi:8-oxo-dGTP pyrophosphatase MutT (NUDIX family)
MNQTSKFLPVNMEKYKEYAYFLLSFKLLLEKDKKVLILTESNTGCFDLPGGRIEKHEDTLPFEKLFSREIGEELGKDVKYKIICPILQFRRYSPYRKIYVLTTVYRAEYLSGSIELSSEHEKYEWINPKEIDFIERKFNNSEEKSALENYFKKIATNI